MLISPVYLLVAATATLLVSFFVLRTTWREKSTLKYLGASFFTMSIFFVVKVLNYQLKFLEIYPDLLMSASPLMFLTAPLFYLGIKGLAENRSSLGKLDGLHFLPALIHFLELMPLYGMPTEEKRKLIDFVLANEQEWVVSAHGFIPMIWVDVCRLILMIGYFVFSWFLIYRANLLQKLFGPEHRASWFRVSIFCFGILQAVFLVQYFFNIQFFFTQISFPWIRNSSVLIVFLTISFYVIQVFRNTRLVLNYQEFDPFPVQKHKLNREVSLPKTAEVAKNFVNPSFEYEELKEAMRILLEEKLIFKEKDLTVTEFAKRLKLSVRALPEILNQVYGKNYKELINQYRCQFAKRKIEEGYLEIYTLESLAELAGFNSRITFYNVFKKEFHLSPTAYWHKFSKEHHLTDQP